MVVRKMKSTGEEDQFGFGLPVENPFTKEEWDEVDKIVEKRRQSFLRRIKGFFFRWKRNQDHVCDYFSAYGEVYNRRKN
jgi:hypothetical protein